MIDLPSLGRELRARRKALRMRGVELAQRTGLSPTYIWLVEQAKPRSNREPSRPSEDVLADWTQALGMNEAETTHIRALAGYTGLPPPRATLTPDRVTQPASADATAPVPASMAAPLTRSVIRDSHGFRADAVRLPSVGYRRLETSDAAQELVDELRATLAAADAQGRGEEAAAMMRSFVQWLAFYLRST